MATWKSNIVEVTLDAHDDYILAEASWEYQTTSDVFSYIEKVTDSKCSSWAKKDQEFTKLHLGPDSAKNLYHALGNWMKVYNSEKEANETIINNMFQKESK
jgi:hypothetical protein